MNPSTTASMVRRVRIDETPFLVMDERPTLPAFAPAVKFAGLAPPEGGR